MPDIFVADQKSTPGVRVKTKTGLGPRYETVAERLLRQRNKKATGAFNIMPGRVRFETQEVREKVILLLRQHWVTQVPWLVMIVVGLALPLLLNWIPLLDFLPGNYQFIMIVIWYLLLLAYGFEQFISWFFHVFIITDERVIDINFYNLIYKEVSEAKIDNIEDVTYRQGGVIRAVFNYGDVAMQTAGEQREFMIERVPLPSRVVKVLNELKLEEEHEKIMGRVR